MSLSESFIPPQSEIDVVEAAVFSLCAERSIALRSQAGVRVAGAAISLFCAGYQTQDALREALCAGDDAVRAL
ncbi:hypothetical protein [Rhizobium sp. CC-YZS058]|uniref:hypothetical protein n=1 Tax=Rhizobium sp. CC-YZS058 TaxID=3042153 RepID=UPI002B0608F5|nr:hypothetical protein [Rhizobium sp. CC-YZS058]MEA3533825.1 hypothetical protein [Rhizobium sp. CC-YZS058]